MQQQAIVVHRLGILARKINAAHEEVLKHANGMLLAAQRAGELLLQAKADGKRTGDIPHGAWETWVTAETKVPYQTAAEYMRVSRVATAKNTDLRTFDGGIRAFLDQHRERGNGHHNPVTFTPDDAEYALKLHALAERGVGGEMDTAVEKLEGFAKQHGMTSGELVQKAKGLRPEPEALTPFDAATRNLMAPYEKLPKAALLSALLKCFVTHPDLMDLIEKDFV